MAAAARIQHSSTGHPQLEGDLFHVCSSCANLYVQMEETPVALETVHVVQSFSVNEFGEYAADDPRAFKTAEAAKEQARKCAERGRPVIAFSRCGDPKIGEYGDPNILVQLGEIPMDVLDAFCGAGA